MRLLQHSFASGISFSRAGYQQPLVGYLLLLRDAVDRSDVEGAAGPIRSLVAVRRPDLAGRNGQPNSVDRHIREAEATRHGANPRLTWG